MLFGFDLEDTWLFALTYSPTRGNSQTKTIRFDDRLSLERARHELKKNISLQWACNKHLSMVELPNATVQTGKTAPGNFLHLRQGLLLDHSGMEGVSSRIIFESSGLRKQGSRPFFGFWFLHGGY